MTLNSCYSQRSFLRKSRRGKPGGLKVREVYQRDDIACNSEACPTCKPSNPMLLSKYATHYLILDGYNLIKYLDMLEDVDFFTTDIILTQTSVDQALRFCTQRETARIRKLLLGQQVQLTRRFVYFPNEHFLPTCTDVAKTLIKNQEDHQSVNREIYEHREDRALLRTREWYSTHLPHVKMILVTNTPDGMSTTCPEQKEFILTCQEYLEQYCIHDPEKLSYLKRLRISLDEKFLNRSLADANEGEPLTSSHLSLEEIEDQLNRRKFFKGKLEVKEENPLEAYVNIGSSKVFVSGRTLMNRALHGDVVAIQILDQSEWKTPLSFRRLTNYKDFNDKEEEEDDLNDKEEEEEEDDLNDKVEEDDLNENKSSIFISEKVVIPTGKVVGILERPLNGLIATILESSMDHSDQTLLAIPKDIRYPKIRIRTQQSKELTGKRLLVFVDGWKVNSQYPHGHYSKILGNPGDLETEISCLLIDYQIAESAFSESAMACLPLVDQVPLEVESSSKKRKSSSSNNSIVSLSNWKIPEEEIARRRDLRTTHCVFSVDPFGCQDIDDALSVRRLDNGNLEVAVHIADVSYFVPKGSALDFEAKNRSTTVYLPDRRYDVLPSLLNSDLCSLLNNTDRLAVSVFFEFNMIHDEVLERIPEKTWMGRTVIHSVAAMTYEQAHGLLEGKNIDEENPRTNFPSKGTAGGQLPLKLLPQLTHDLQWLVKVGKFQQKLRYSSGSVPLSSDNELKFKISPLGVPEKVVFKVEEEIHRTIAELMILSNSTVAECLFNYFPDSSLLRRHIPPSLDRFDELKECCSGKNLEFQGENTSSSALQKWLDEMSKNPQVDSNIWKLLNSLTTLAMSEAEYLCSEKTQPLEFSTGSSNYLRHYGLGIEMYTHFTSPIRRYADLVVHRMLLSILEQPSNHPIQGDKQKGKELGEKKLGEKELGENKLGEKKLGVKKLGEKKLGEKEQNKEQKDWIPKQKERLVLPPSLTPSVLKTNSSSLQVSCLKTTSSSSSLDASATPIPTTTSTTTSGILVNPYSKLEVHTICEHINAKSRNAKLISRSCDQLFLSQYFKNRKELETGIILSLRLNGFFVYIPRYNIKGPVYLKDREGFIHLDPHVLGVSYEETEPPSSGFEAVENVRKLARNATLELNEDRTQLLLSCSKSGQSHSFRTLDQITVQISCDLSVATVRIPPLRLGFVHFLKTSSLSLSLSGGSRSPSKCGGGIHGKCGGSSKKKSIIVPKLEDSPELASDLDQMVDVKSSMEDMDTMMHHLHVVVDQKRFVGKKQHDDVQVVVEKRSVGRKSFGNFRSVKKDFRSGTSSQYSEEEDKPNPLSHENGYSETELRRLSQEAQRRSQKLLSARRHDRINNRKKNA